MAGNLVVWLILVLFFALSGYILIAWYVLIPWIGPPAAKMKLETVIIRRWLGGPTAWYLMHSDNYRSDWAGNVIPVRDDLPLDGKLPKPKWRLLGAWEINWFWPFLYTGNEPEVKDLRPDTKKIFIPRAELKSLGIFSRDIELEVTFRICNPFWNLYGGVTSWYDTLVADVKSAVNKIAQSITQEGAETEGLLERMIQYALVVKGRLLPLLSSNLIEAEGIFDEIVNDDYEGKRPSELIIGQIGVEVCAVVIGGKDRPESEESAAAIRRDGASRLELRRQFIEQDLSKARDMAEIAKTREGRFALKMQAIGKSGGNEEGGLILDADIFEDENGGDDKSQPLKEKKKKNRKRRDKET